MRKHGLWRTLSWLPRACNKSFNAKEQDLINLLGLGVDDGEFKFGAGDDLAVDGAGGNGGADGAAEAEDLGVDEEGVSGDDWFAEFDFVGAEEVADFTLITGHAHDEYGGGLGHGLELEDTWHDGVPWEVALEELLIHGEVLDGGALHFGGEVGDAVDEEEGVAVGEDF